MNTNRQVFRNPSPTLGAEPRRVSGRNFNYSASDSLFRFPPKNIEEFKPSYISHGSVESTMRIPQVHLLNEDSIIFLNKLVNSFKMKILSLISDFFVGFGNQKTSLLSSVRVFDSAGKSLISHFENILRVFKETGISYSLPFRSGEEKFATNIDPNGFASLRKGFYRDIITRKSSEPFICRTSANGDGFNITFDGSRKTKFENADFPDSKILTIQFPATLFQGEAIISVSAFEAGEAWFFSILHSAKEPLIGFIQAFNYILEHLRTYLQVFRKVCLELGELLFLAIIGDRTFVLPVDGNALLKGSIVEVATEIKPRFSLLDSSRICLNAVLKRLSHLPSPISILTYLRGESKKYNA